MGVAKVLVPNITSDPVKGIGAWSDEELKRALTTGVAVDGHVLRYPMPWPYLSHLTPSDLDALVVWIRRIPPRG